MATTSTAGAASAGGFLRAPSGALVYAPAAPGVSSIHNGFAQDVNGALATTQVDPAPAFLQHGLKFDPSRRVYAVVVV